MKTRTVRCPQCGGESLYTPDNPFRPFCCKRCRLIDLGAWANEQYRVPVQATPGLGGEFEAPPEPER